MRRQLKWRKLPRQLAKSMALLAAKGFRISPVADDAGEAAPERSVAAPKVNIMKPAAKSIPGPLKVNAPAVEIPPDNSSHEQFQWQDIGHRLCDLEGKVYSGMYEILGVPAIEPKREGAMAQALVKAIENKLKALQGQIDVNAKIEFTGDRRQVMWILWCKSKHLGDRLTRLVGNMKEGWRPWLVGKPTLVQLTNLLTPSERARNFMLIALGEYLKESLASDVKVQVFPTLCEIDIDGNSSIKLQQSGTAELTAVVNKAIVDIAGRDNAVIMYLMDRFAKKGREQEFQLQCWL